MQNTPRGMRLQIGIIGRRNSGKSSLLNALSRQNSSIVTPLAGTTTDPSPAVADVGVLRNIFGARFADGADQEILDVIDMALGVYDASRFIAMARTVNPFHYAMTALGFVAGLPRRGLTAVGLWPRRSRAPRIRTEDVARLAAVASRLGAGE